MATQAAPNKQKQYHWLILVAIGLFSFMSNLDASIVNIAMPQISKGLAIPVNQAEWVTSIYLIFMCALLLFFGRLGDMYGKTRVFKVGTLVFILGSFLSGLELSLGFLLFARIIQAFGASMTLSNSFGIVTSAFALKQRGRAMGFVGTFVALGSVAGPALGGLILAHLTWGYIFWVNVPVGIIAILISFIVFPKQDQRKSEPMDWPGFLSFAGFIVALFMAIFLGQEWHFNDLRVLGLFLAALILLITFIVVERRHAQPLVDFKLFKNQPFTYGLVSALLIFLSNFFPNVLMPFYLYNARGFAIGMAGLLLAIFPIVMLVAGPIGGYLADYYNAQFVTIIGLSLIAVSQFLFTFLQVDTALWYYVSATVIMALGTGLFQSPNNDLVMSSVDKSQLGVAGSINALARNLGMVLGVAFATTVLFWGMSFAGGYKITTYVAGRPDLFLAGSRIAYIVSMVFCLLADGISIARYIQDKRAAVAKS
ncbi:MAG: MFS transporter [Lactobacillus sp.]|jgi:EmrB/QacA subfamily drug resistance transporter|nr:MFS transporter [Lactobacillus sp.]